MSFTNAQLAQKIADLITYWSDFNEEYSNWLGGVVGGGTNLDGKYPLTDWTGNTLLVKAPAQLQDDVDNITSGATAQANAAAASAVAADASATTASTQAGLADAARIAAELAETNAETAETSSVNASVTSVAQANLASDRAGYAQEWANAAHETLVSVAAGGNGVDDYSARHWATVAEGFAGSIDSNLYAQLAQDETITGQWKFLNTGVNSWIKFQKGGASNTVGLDFINESGVRRLTNYLSNAQDFYMDWYNSSGIWQGSAFVIDTDTGNISMGAALSVTGAVTGSNLNVANWDTAYGWGNHASAGYAALSGGTYTGNHIFNDGFQIGDAASRIIVNDSADAGTRLYIAGRNAGDTGWNFTAEFGWNHTAQKWYFDSDILIGGQTLGASHLVNYDTAYSWGNHASAGYALSSHNHSGVYVPVSGASYIQSTGYSSSWGATNGVNTGALNAIMGTSSSATWLVSGTSNGVFRGGFQLLDSGGSWRLYANTNYVQFTGSTLQVNGVNLASTASPSFTGTVNLSNAVNISSADTTLSRLAAGKLGVEGKAVIKHAGAYTSGEVTFSTSDPSSGSSGDIWYKYT